MSRNLLYSLALLFVTGTSSAHAHFVWLVPSSGPNSQSTVNVYFGEDATDSNSELLGRLKGIKLHSATGTEPPSALNLAWTKDSLTATADLTGNTVVISSHDLGVMDRGDNVFRLKYYSKTGPDLSTDAWTKAETSDDLRLDIVPRSIDGKLQLTVRFDGNVVAGAQVKAARPGMDDFEGLTGTDGTVLFDVAENGLHSVRARHVEKASGELNGKKYPETRHYSTAAINVSTFGSLVEAAKLQNLPQPVTSFGAAVVADSLYMYGGHTGDAHSYSKQDQSHQLSRLDLTTGKWNTVLDGPHLQGLALVTHGGKLYRIGGFSAMNEAGEDHDLQSQNAVALFDPAADHWQSFPNLPERRSSHDAAVVGDTIYVAGGWSMGGEEGNQWHSTAWKVDLTNAAPQWEAIANPPFQRRALALAAHDGKLYAVGGMQISGGPTAGVAIYDPVSNQWSNGPALHIKAAEESKEEEGTERDMAAGRMAGFGASAFATGGRLYATTVQGLLQRLSNDGSQWEVISSDITPRFFHRLLALNDKNLIAVGGANMSIGKFAEVDVFDVGAIQ